MADPTAIEAFTASIQGLTLDNFFLESFKGLISRSPESVVSLTLESIFPITGDDVDNLSDPYRHHTQIAIATEANVPVFRKIVRSTVFTEGWALYAERLAFELGWYDNGAVPLALLTTVVDRYIADNTP